MAYRLGRLFTAFDDWVHVYARQKNVQILVALLKEHGVRHIVISPGSRNMAIVRSVETDPYFTCYSVVDERSAAYFAIGISLEKGEPVALSCTSAQATRNYIPGMTEAFYRGIPLLAITADYDQSLVGQGIMQSIDQMSLPVDSRKLSVRLPVVRDASDEWYCGRLVNEALLALNHNGSGPAHIDIPIDEHWEGSVDVLPPVKKIERFMGRGEALPSINDLRVMVVVGEHAPFTQEQSEALESFVRSYSAVVYTNHLSNYKGDGSVNGSLVVAGMDRRTRQPYVPDLVITIGEQNGDYGIDGFLRGFEPRHWRVNQDGKIVDTYRSLTAVFQMPEEQFFREYARVAQRTPSGAYQALWAKANASRVIPEGLPLSHAMVAGVLSPMIPSGSVMHFAILSSLRNWSFFHLDPSIQSYSNVAAFGIDGCMSAFIGHSVATQKLSFLVIGDLSFFYDMSSIGNRHVKANARIVLVNNGGGGEFRTYSHAADQYFGDDADVHIAAAGHHGSARGWVESLGWRYVEVRTESELAAAGEVLVGESEEPVLIEVFTTMKADSDGVKMIREANTHRSLESRLAQSLPPNVRKAAKRALGR